MKTNGVILENDDGLLSLYLDEIKESRGLPSEKEAVLARRIRKGDKRAVKELVRNNLLFVVKVARSYMNQGLPLSDLINIGNVGLIAAAKKFDERKNFRFISYAVWWIRQSILQELALQSRIVRIPVNRVSEIQNSRKAVARLEQKNHRTPHPEEIAQELELDKNRDIDSVLALDSLHVSLHRPVGNSNVPFQDNLIDDKSEGTDHQAHRNSMIRKSEKLLQHLDARQQYIVKEYFGMNEHDCPRTLEEIALTVGVTRERVRQLKDKAISQLRHLVKVRSEKMMFA